MHNFHIRRPDGTTAAQRFFGAEHDDLFERLIDKIPQLARPYAWPGCVRRPITVSM